METANRRLLLVWLAMAILTLAAIPIGHAADPRPLGAGLIIALLATAFVKTALLLNDYLGLRDAPGWNSGLRSAIAVLLVILAGLSILSA